MELRRLFVLLLLVVLPFKAVASAAGIACAVGSAPRAAAAMAQMPVVENHGMMHGNAPADTHENAHSDGHAAHAAVRPAHADHRVHVSDSIHAAHAAQASDATHAQHDHGVSDACRFCMECCASAATAPVFLPAARAPLAPLRLSAPAATVHPHGTRAGVFRPPRFLA